MVVRVTVRVRVTSTSREGGKGKQSTKEMRLKLSELGREEQMREEGELRWWGGATKEEIQQRQPTKAIKVEAKQ